MSLNRRLVIMKNTAGLYRRNDSYALIGQIRG